MGVDISGLNPVVNTERPPYIDYDNATQEEKDAYWELIEKYRRENPGEYFHSNWWGWRPIHALCEVVQQKYKLRINTSLWGENSGGGLRNPEICNKLADCIEQHISENLSEELKEDDDRIYLNLGSWTTTDGRFVGQEINQQLNEKYPFGTVLHTCVVLEDGMIMEPSHSSSYGRIKEWIAFLRNCGGFEIY